MPDILMIVPPLVILCTMFAIISFVLPPMMDDIEPVVLEAIEMSSSTIVTETTVSGYIKDVVLYEDKLIISFKDDLNEYIFKNIDKYEIFLEAKNQKTYTSIKFEGTSIQSTSLGEPPVLPEKGFLEIIDWNIVGFVIILAVSSYVSYRVVIFYYERKERMEEIETKLREKERQKEEQRMKKVQVKVKRIQSRHMKKTDSTRVALASMLIEDEKHGTKKR